MKQMFTTAYHPHKNGQAERLDNIIASKLQQYIADNQKDWDAYVGPLTYVYILQVHRSTGNTALNLVLSRALPSAVI